MDAPQPQASYPCGNFSDTYNQIYFMGYNVIKTMYQLFI